MKTAVSACCEMSQVVKEQLHAVFAGLMGHLTCILSNEDMVFMQVEPSRQARFDSAKTGSIAFNSKTLWQVFFAHFTIA